MKTLMILIVAVFGYEEAGPHVTTTYTTFKTEKACSAAAAQLPKTHWLGLKSPYEKFLFVSATCVAL